MMLRLSQNAYIRQYGPFTYVLNRLDNSDQMYCDAEEFVRKIFDLSLEKKIPLIIVAFPNPDYNNDQLYYNSLWKIADEYGIPYIDYNTAAVRVGLDYTSDFADLQHLNVQGSMKMSVRLGQDLKNLFDLADRRGDPAYTSYDACIQTWFDGLPSFRTAPAKGSFDFY